MPKISKPLYESEIKNARYTSEEEFKILEKELAKNNPNEKAVKKNKLADGKGLYLIIKPNGSKLWRFDFRYGNKNLSMSFGIYPEVSLKEAREKREEARELLSKNINPISVKRIKRASEALTLDMIINEWLELRAKSSSEATIIQNRRMLNNITNWLGNIAIKDIKRVDIINILEKIQNKGVIETAHRILSLMNKIYMFAVTKEYIEHNIIADIDKKSVLVPSNKNIHHPAITLPDEIKVLLRDINSIGERFRSNISIIFIFKIIPYVFVRSENIRLMRWNELDLEEGIWEIPKEKMKTHIDFVCPLSRQAVDIIKKIEPYSRHRSEFVFPSPSKNDRGISGATLSDTLNKLGYQNRHTFHGFRSMFSTIAYEYYKEHGFHSDIIESCLAHKEKNRVKAAYNRESKYKYFEEKKELMQWWADWLDNLVK
ncbi:tyrosine-type recombinase/integrase [Aliarcobacter butzleri]|uniref:tyrosine-type recombinase/integrase n=1 Tax=Aliarcobacter butzleri TaxID=28197 RepID=UPI0021B446AA|nr:integrase arm-type DNA-binding domain-containing protein [Aliarcobacter butzleri]MCT7588979.1 integrase arm-type DNA-binding domain-containing protein [Aliarcobacter butzleri]MCT7628925.1 integrase arm-type DNA-binding domain-containing protein [Aliarcobacter butzleri]